MRIDDYESLAELHRSERVLVTRAQHRATGDMVIIKALPPARLHQTPMARLRYEYRVLQLLNAAAVAHVPQALHLLEEPGVAALVLGDVAGRSLRMEHAAQPLLPVDALHVATQVVAALVGVHRARVVHKDLNPNNIIFNRQNGAVQLIDFDLASQLERELQSVDSLTGLEGTLAYLSPEQTGRQNRSLDYRSDFYSLGVTLYELLCGQLPFPGDNPAEVVYAILTQVPAPIGTIVPTLPPVIGDIVLKLLHKDAEDRYQSATGLQQDLQRCLSELRATGNVAPFPLGQHDVSERFEISQRLYGRTAETELLLAAYEHAATGKQEYVFVTGPSGIGKSALVTTLQSAILHHNALFGAGKYELLHRHQPFTALTHACNAIVRRIMTEPADALEVWRRRLQAALGSIAQGIVDLVPALELLLGPQKPVPTLGPQENENRLLTLWQNLVRALSKTQPLVLFLDDLQWADHGTIKLLRRIAGEPHRGAGLLIAGAYRDNEVAADHPLHALFQELQTDHARVQKLRVAPLNEADIGALVRDTTCTDATQAAPLAAVLMTKTAGIPFFVHEFLKTLRAQDLITYAPEHSGWHWNIDAIRAATVTANVADLLSNDLRALAPEQQEIIMLAACVGTEVQLATLCSAAQLPASTVAQRLHIALVQGLLLPVGGAYRYAVDDPSKVTYRFAHDKIQQAAYDLLPADTRVRHHYTLGRVVLAQAKASALQVVYHFNLARDLLRDVAERLEVAQLNSVASQEARLAAAYDLAVACADTGLQLLAGESWHNQRTLLNPLHLVLAQTYALTQRPEKAREHLDILFDNATTRPERIVIARERVVLMTTARQAELALAASTQALQLIGVPLTAHPKIGALLRAFITLQWTLRGRSAAQFATWDNDANAELATAGSVLAAVTEAAMTFLDPLLFVATLLHTTRLYIAAHQVSVRMALGMTLLNTSLNRYPSARQWAQLARDRLPSARDTSTPVTGQFVLASTVDHVNMSASALLQEFERTSEQALQVGESLVATSTGASGMFVQFALALDTCLLRIRNPSPSMQLVRELSQASCDSVRLACETLSGQHGEHFLHLYDSYDAALPAELPQVMRRGPFHYHNAVAAYVHRDFAVAFTSVAQTIRDGAFEAVPDHFGVLVAMQALLICTQHTPPKRPLWWRRALAKVRRAGQAGTTYTGFALLADAELAALRNNPVAASLYERAITALMASGYTMFVAMALENAGRLQARGGVHSAAALLLSRARETYRAWGATHKLTLLDREFSDYDLRPGTQASSTRNSSRLEANEIDIPAMVAMTQALGAEMVEGTLLDKLLRTLQQSAGATRAALLLRNGDAWPVVADSHTGTAALPQELIRYVVRAREAVVLNAVDKSPDFKDTFTETPPPKAALCAPIKHQGQVKGVIYLENHVASGVFGPERLVLVDMLASQAAIALENARLYAHLEDVVAQRTQALHQAHARLLHLERQATETQMAGGFAHEMRNALAGASYALSSIISNTDTSPPPEAALLPALADLKALPNTPTQEALQTVTQSLVEQEGALTTDILFVQRSVARALRITDKILDYAQVGDLLVSDDSVAIGQVLDRVLHASQERLQTQGVTASIQVDTTLRVPMREEHVETVLQNLVANALDALQSRPAGSRQLQIRLKEHESDLELAVSDTGAGIATADQARIFQPFFTTKGAHGAGLGLALCKKIMRAYGGSISFTSNPTAPGSTFSISIERPAKPRA